MTSVEYETLFRDIVKGIRASDQKATGISIGSGSKNRILGASGFKHQIDVSFTYDKRSYIVECKKWKSKVDAAEVLVLASRKQDIEASGSASISAIIVSQVGATRGAKQLAKHFGIEFSVAKSAAEFGLRLGQKIFLAVQEKLAISESVSVNVNDGKRSMA